MASTSACLGATPAPDSDPIGDDSDERQQAADEARDRDKAGEPPLQIHWLRNSAEYVAATTQAYALATAKVAAHAATEPTQPWGVILDVDETTLDNSQFEIERLGLGYSATAWRKWVLRREATAVPGAAAFTQAVRAAGGYVALVTNRNNAVCTATKDNLAAQDIAFDVVLCKGTSSEKEARFAKVAAGTAAPGVPALAVKLFIGDNIKDFPDLTQDMRFDAPEGLAAFGEKYIVLPNPMYGSWESNEPR
ncbi:MAG: hypothetical protein IPL79_08830 [Myxococcales bacterium]|nr:hypothetical protein [Myxococcales bacterium]